MCNFTEKDLEFLKVEIKKLLSEKRFNHTLGVEKAAERIGLNFIPELVYELRAAALLHDVAKELDRKSVEELIKGCPFDVSLDDMSTPQAYHSFAAPAFILKNFKRFATDNILSSVFNHTLGSPDMSIFDQIIFVSDYIEEGREYYSCKVVRDFIFSKLNTVSQSDAEAVLRKAVVMSIDFTLESLKERGITVNSRTLMTKAAFEALN